MSEGKGNGNCNGNRFWERKSFDQMSEDEWESICDGCGLCCLHRLEDEDSGEIVTSNIACKLLDINNCRCKDYKNRFSKVPDCTKLTADNILSMVWLPKTCSYVYLLENGTLPKWHYLLTGSRETVHDKAIGVSWKDELISESDVDMDDFYK